MRTITLKSPGTLVLEDTPPPVEVPSGHARVRVGRVGVCGTDLHAYRGRQPFFSYPRILGHELGVEVVQVGADVSNVAAGDRCSVEPYLDCGSCVACRRGRGNCCVNLRVLGVHVDGGMREQFVLPASKLHPSKTLSLDQLALVEPLGIGAHAVARAQVENGEMALVIGSGPIGLSVVQFVQAAGAIPIVMDINADRLAFCQRQFGVEHTVLGGAEVLEQLKTITDGDLPTAVFDATGNPGSMMASFNYAAHGGRLVFVGLFQGEVTFDDPNFHRRELTLMGSRNALPGDFERIIQLMEAGKVDTTPWITHRVGCEGMIEDFESWLDPANQVLKAMIDF